MKIGILYICTGNYKIFWKDFYLSCEKYFITEAEKHYFVFTDSKELDFEKDNDRIYKSEQANLGWPDNTLKRYEIFLKVKEIIKNFDYLIFFNANLQFLENISAKEFLPQGKEKLIACLHPGYFNKIRKDFTYEKNKNSLAFIPDGQGQYYFAGGINGGLAKDFILAAERISKDIIVDLKKKNNAIWHDESYWNKYLACREDVKILSPTYLYPEGLILPFEKKILIRDKKMLGGHGRLRGKLEFKLFVNEVKGFISEFVRVFSTSKVIKISGGLGNQLFQYAHGRNLELLGKKVIFDVSFFHGNKSKKDTARDFKLDKFNLETKILFSNKNFRCLNIFSKIKRFFGFKVEEYFQNEKYFFNIASIIRREFTLRNEFSAMAKEFLNKIRISESISLHIRRGDYVSNQNANAFHGVCDLNYYRRAMTLLKEKVSHPKFFIFSDDIAWAKENFIGSNFVFVSCPEIVDYEEMILMSNCKHNIIANSTFSWWGGWLNNHTNKIVVAPIRWFSDSKVNAANNIVPNDWTRL